MHFMCCVFCLVSWFNLLFFFFKQKTAYEMRISDWSSDVCSSDLQKRELRAEVSCGIDRQSVAQLVQHGREHLPGDLPVGADLVDDLVQPDVGRLKRLVEDLESGDPHLRQIGRAHV